MAFATSVTLHRTASSRRATCSRPLRTPRMDVGLSTIAFDVGALSVVVGGIGAYVFWDKLPNRFTDLFKPETKEDSQPTTAEVGVLGLMGDLRSEPRSASFAFRQPKKQFYRTEPIAAPPERANQEATWASNVLADLGSMTMVIFDADRNVLRAEGDLFVKDQPAGTVVYKGSETLRDNAAEFPCIADTARSVGCWPIGDSGALLVLASTEPDFFDAHETRIIKAVLSRLSNSVSNLVSNLGDTPELAAA